MAEKSIELDSVEIAAAVFGNCDRNIRMLEKEFSVTAVCRGTMLRISGEPANVAAAARAVEGMLLLIENHTPLEDQTVRYCLSLAHDGKEQRVRELEKLKVHPRDLSENQQMMERLEALYQEVYPEQKEQVQQMTTYMANFVSHIAKVLPDDIIKKLDELGAQEDAPLSKVIYETMKRNQKLAKELNRPSCQDTGVLQFWVKCGVDFPLIGEVEGLLKEAVVKSTFEAPLRHNSVETFDEFNTGLNVGKGTPTVWWDIIPNSDKCEIYAYMAGGGCTLPGKAMVLMPGAGYEGVTKFVMDVMTSYGINACPPLLVGVGVATSVETAALLSKKALMRPLGSHNENERAAYMEKLLEDGINSIGLGPQGMGGKYSVMGVHIENTARHPSAIGVAVNVGCWSHRRGHIIFDKDLNYTIDTHSGVTL